MLRLDDLCCRGWKIWQDTERFCFGTDAVLLAWFAARKRYLRAVDLGCGNGILPLLLAKNDRAVCSGVEIDPYAVELAQKSVEENGLSARVRIFCEDLLQTSLPAGGWDLVTSNPPYFLPGAGKPARDAVSACRAETSCTFAQITAAAARLLRYGGRFCFIQKPQRLTEVFSVCSAQGLEPKELLLICPRVDREPEWMLAECRKGAAAGLKIHPPLVMYDAQGRRTPAFAAVYQS